MLRLHLCARRVGEYLGFHCFFSPLCTSAVNHKHLLALLVTEAVCAAAGIRLMLQALHSQREKNKGVILVLRAVQVSVANSTILTYLSS